MFGINSLKAQVAELSQQLYWAQRKIYDLENPYTLSVGQKVKVYNKNNELAINLKNHTFMGFVVKIRHNYHKKAPYHVSEHRVNYYTIYNDFLKTTEEFTDDIYLFETIN